MKWFLNLRVAHKLALSFGGCLVLATIAGIGALVRMASMDQAATKLYADSIKGDDVLLQIISDVKQYRTWQIRYGTMKEQAGWSECDSNLSQIAAETDGVVQQYAQHASDPADAANAKALAAQWQAMVNITPEIARICKSGSTRDIQGVIVSSFVPAKAAEDVLSAMSQWNSSHADALVATAHQTYQSAQRIVGVLLICALVFGVLLAWAVTRIVTSSLSSVSEKLNNLNDSLSGQAENAEALAKGDFVVREIHRTSPMSWDRTDEFGDLSRTFDSMLVKAKRVTEAVIDAQKSLTRLVGSVRASADIIATSSSELSAGNEDLSQRTSEEAASLETTASSMEQMTSIVKQSAENAQQANELASQARDVAKNGGEIVTRAVDSMNEINVASKRISDIIAVIDEIAFQTNLLALNAAVEAARVGEQGRGFAVVASEVRNLAGRSSTAAKEIKALVQDSVRKVEDGAELVNKSGDQLKDIVSAVDRVAAIVAEISSGAQEQSTGIEQVNRSVVQLDQITQQNAALVEEASAASQAMAHQAADLRNQMRKFRLDDSLAAAPEPHIAPPATAPAASRPRLKIVGSSEDVEIF